MDPAGALRHIEALTAGVSRRAAIQRTLLPVLLGWFADAPEPDAGLLAFRQVSEALGDSPWYLRLLRDNTLVAQRMARVLASSRYATGLLLRAPEAVAMLADDRRSWPRARRRLLRARRWPRWAGTRWRPRPSAPCWPSAAASCCAPRWPTCSAWPGSTRAGRGADHGGRGHRGGRAGGRRGRGRAGDRAAADPAGGDLHGPARRPGDGLRQRRRRAVRARPAARRGRGGRLAGRALGGRDPARAAGHAPARPGPATSTRACGRRAARARWSARWPPTGPITGAGRCPGRRRPCCGPSSRPAMPGSAPTFLALADEFRYPEGGIAEERSGRSGGSRPGWRPSGCRAAWTRP